MDSIHLPNTFSRLPRNHSSLTRHGDTPGVLYWLGTIMGCCMIMEGMGGGAAAPGGRPGTAAHGYRFSTL